MSIVQQSHVAAASSLARELNVHIGRDNTDGVAVELLKCRSGPGIVEQQSQSLDHVCIILCNTTTTLEGYVVVSSPQTSWLAI